MKKQNKNGPRRNGRRRASPPIAPGRPPPVRPVAPHAAVYGRSWRLIIAPYCTLLHLIAPYCTLLRLRRVASASAGGRLQAHGDSDREQSPLRRARGSGPISVWAERRRRPPTAERGRRGGGGAGPAGSGRKREPARARKHTHTHTRTTHTRTHTRTHTHTCTHARTHALSVWWSKESTTHTHTHAHTHTRLVGVVVEGVDALRRLDGPQLEQPVAPRRQQLP